MKIMTIIRLCGKNLLVLLAFVLAPFVAVRFLMPQVPFTLHYFLIVLFAIKYILHNDQKYRQKIRPQLKKCLSDQLKKMPSEQQLISSTETLIQVRDISLLTIAMIGIIINILL